MQEAAPRGCDEIQAGFCRRASPPLQKLQRRRERMIAVSAI